MSRLTTDDYIAQMLDWCEGHERRFFQIDFYPDQKLIASVTAYLEEGHPLAEEYPYSVAVEKKSAPAALEAILKKLVPEDD